ncbi:MAG: peptidase M28 family protein, partial [Gemmatimonadales bacterium]
MPWLLCSVAAAPALGQSAPPAASITQRYRATADQLIAAAIKDSTAYARLGELVDRFGARFSGTPNLERALNWILEQMRRDGLENVRGEPVMIPRWVRGRESAELIEPRAKSLAMLGLGGSIATPKKGITAPVLVVSSFSDLDAHAAEAKGKIVLFDAPFTAYRETVRYRYSGASAAAKVGAVAALVRSVTPQSINSPHTGVMGYDST